MAFARRSAAKISRSLATGSVTNAQPKPRGVLSISMPQAELVIGTGVAGALSRGLKPGDLVLSDRILMIHADGQQAKQRRRSSAAHIRAIGRSLASAGIAYSTGAILTSHRVFTVAEKRGAKESTGAIAVDMETAALASEAAVRGLPFVAIRAVLDEVDDEVVGAEMADEDGNVGRSRRRRT